MTREQSVLVYRYPLSLADDIEKARGRIHGSYVGHAVYGSREVARDVARNINDYSLLTAMTVSVIVHVKKKSGVV